MGLFDGMAGTLNATFGGPVTIYPGGGAGVAITGVVRDTEFETTGDQGEPVVTAATVLKALSGDVTGLVAGDRVDANGSSWSVEYQLPAESPAADRFETFILGKA